MEIIDFKILMMTIFVITLLRQDYEFMYMSMMEETHTII